MSKYFVAAFALTAFAGPAMGQTFLKLDFDSAADGTFTSGTVYTPGGTEVVDTAAVGLGTADIRFVDSGAPDDVNEVAADGATIGNPPAGVTGTRQGGKALLVQSGDRDEGLRVNVGAPLLNQSFTMEAIWFTENTAAPGNNGGGIQTIIGDNWPQLDLNGPNTDPRRSQFQMSAVGPNTFQYYTDQGSINLSGTPVNVANTWYHDALVFRYNDANPAQSYMVGYRNGRAISVRPYNASSGEVIGLFGETTSSLHSLTIGMLNSFEYRINDHRRGLHGGVDAIAVTSGALVASQFALPHVTPAAYALPVSNHSFEADAVGNPYRPSITGWTYRHGATISVDASGGPFFNNGTNPDGTKVGVLQNVTGLSQMVPGFQAGQTYAVRVHANARAGNVPTIQISVNGSVVLPATTVNSVGGTNPFILMEQAFLSPGEGTYELLIENTNGSGDNSLLIDKVEIVPVASAARDWQLLQ